MGNYGFFYPSEIDQMSDVKASLTNNFKTIEKAGDVSVIAAGAPLPQSGNYVIGDKVFRDDPADFQGNPIITRSWPSCYILIAKDINWGWHWRPVQQIMSPWVNVPASAIMHSSFEIHPQYPLAIALDSKGWCHWRGAIRAKTAGGLTPVATSINVFNVLPVGIRPNINLIQPCALTPVMSGTGKAGNVSGRLGISPNGLNSFRFFNTANGTSQVVWLSGLKYANSDSHYYNA